MTCKIYLVRHGESVSNRDKIVDGANGPDGILTEKGRAQARETARLLQDVHFDAFYSSDLKRAVETAEIISGQEVAADHQLRDLRERDFGPLENTATDDWFRIDEQFNERYAVLPFAERSRHEFTKGVETDHELVRRVEQALRQIALANDGRTVLVAAHGGCIRGLLMQLDYASFLPAGSFENAGYVEIDCDDGNFDLRRVVGVRKPGDVAE